MVIATIVEKVVLVALWSKIIVMLLTLAMVMGDLIMLAMNPCITTWNQTKKVVTKTWSFKIVFFQLMGMPTLNLLIHAFQ